MNDERPGGGQPGRRPGQGPGQGQGQGPGRAQRLRQQALANEEQGSSPSVRPPARPAGFKRRHRGVRASFLGFVVVPFALIAAYLYVFAHDQFASTTGFTVRSEETSSATDLVGGLSSFVGGGTSSNTGVLFAYIQSQQIVERIQEQLDIRAHFSQNWGSDPVFSIWPDASIEDLLWFWGRIVRVSYDQSSGLMEVQTLALTAAYAQQIAAAIVRESEAMINDLNAQARSDTMASADADLVTSLARLRGAREELASFRARTQILDPFSDIQGRMGVINNLQQQLAQALVDHDLLLQITAETDPRVRQAERRIEVIRERIATERSNFATQDVTVFDTDYPRLIAQFEGLTVNQQFAERTYTAALTARDAARSNVERQSLYLATYVRPTLAQRAEYPQRLMLAFLTGLFLTLAWSAVTLVYYSLRDRG